MSLAGTRECAYGYVVVESWRAVWGIREGYGESGLRVIVGKRAF